MVIDPKESWSQFFSSMVNLDQPKVIPLSEAPEDYNPNNRPLQRLRTVINWRNQNYLESFRPKSAVSCDLNDGELYKNEPLHDIEMGSSKPIPEFPALESPTSKPLYSNEEKHLKNVLMA